MAPRPLSARLVPAGLRGQTPPSPASRPRHPAPAPGPQDPRRPHGRPTDRSSEPRRDPPNPGRARCPHGGPPSLPGASPESPPAPPGAVLPALRGETSPPGDQAAADAADCEGSIALATDPFSSGLGSRGFNQGSRPALVPLVPPPPTLTHIWPALLWGLLQALTSRGSTGALQPGSIHNQDPSLCRGSHVPRPAPGKSLTQGLIKAKPKPKISGIPQPDDLHGPKMEAEEPHPTVDAEEHPSSNDPPAEDSEEPPIPDIPLELVIAEPPLEPHTSEAQILSSTSQSELESDTSDTPMGFSVSKPPPLESHSSASQVTSPTSQTELETHTSENPLEPSTSEPLEPHTSEPQAVPSTSQTPLAAHASESPVEPSTSKASVEHATSKVPEEPSALQTPSPDQVSDALKKGLSSEPGRSAQIREPEMLPEHSLVGPSAEVHLDTVEKEREEEGEDKEGEDATVSTTHTPQPGQHVGKKKEKKGVSRDTANPVIIVKQADQVGVPKTMHEEKSLARADNLFQWEKDAALKAIQTGLYIGWRCPHYLWDCFRIGDESKCFCGHLLREHRIVSDISVPCKVSQCRCLMFCFIPSRPEEVGEFWLQRRATFDPKTWRAQCRCKHSHENHSASGCHPCRVKGCCCSCFESNFLCAACDRRWEEHGTFFETEENRRRGRRPRGADYVPFAEIPTLRETITGNSDFEVLQRQGPSGQPSSHPIPPGLPVSPSLRPGPTAHPRT